MLRLLLFVTGVAFVAIVSLPGVSLGEHPMQGIQSINAPHGPGTNVSAQGGPIRAPHAPELSPQSPAGKAYRSADPVGSDKGRTQGPVTLARNASQWLPARPAETGFVQPPSAPEVRAADPSMPSPLRTVLAKSFPERTAPRLARSGTDQRVSATSQPSPADDRNMDTLLTPNDADKSVSSIPTGPESKYRNLVIEVSHAEHTFKLFGVLASGQKDLLKECKVGLGNPREFPTPVGVYFVTHIYDKDPLWIPPPDRPWAWGQSPSNRVYGGTMAPLLKKRPLTSRNKGPIAEDYIADEVKLDDYGYRFHGTNAPRSIGRNQSHGCVRMLPEDARAAAALITDYVGVTARKESENGTFVVLRAPVRLNLVK